MKTFWTVILVLSFSVSNSFAETYPLIKAGQWSSEVKINGENKPGFLMKQSKKPYNLTALLR